MHELLTVKETLSILGASRYYLNNKSGLKAIQIGGKFSNLRYMARDVNKLKEQNDKSK